MTRHSYLFLLLFMCVQGFGETAIYGKDVTPMPCDVVQPFESALVKAYLEKGVSALEGCVTNATTNSQIEVHIISFRSLNNTDQDIELILKDYHEQGFEQPFIIILSSNVKTHWQIRLGRNAINPERHLFVTSKSCGIRFTKKRLLHQPRVLKEKWVPVNVSDLLQWTYRKYSAVTSTSVFNRGNSITLTIGRASVGNPSSQPLSSLPQCNIQGNSAVQLPASGIVRQRNTVAGCVVDGRSHTESDLKYAYVVEMKNVPQRRPFVVDIDLRLGWNATEHVTFWLVLKSSSNVKWKVHARHSEGYIILVSNDDVDDKGVHITTTAVRRETMDESGPDLLHWVQVHLGRIGMYISLNNTNKLRLTLPRIDVKKLKPELPNRPSELPDWSMEHILKRALRTTCDSHYVTVAINSKMLEMFGIKSSTLSLMDRKCRAQRNNTHVYIESRRDNCGTKLLRTQQGRLQYVNTLVLQAAGTVTEDGHGYDTFHDTDSLDSLNTDGSGLDDIFSGSGDGGVAHTQLDDEDLYLRPLEIGFSCNLTTRQQPMFQLELFHSKQYVEPYARFPIDIPNIHQRLYVQAMVMSDPLVQANFEHCWLSSVNEDLDKNRFTLLQNRCLIDSTVVMQPNADKPQSERFSFTLEKFVEKIRGPGVYLKCQMTDCCLQEPCIGSKKCVPYQPGSCNRHSNRHYNPPSMLVIVGPVMLPQTTTEKCPPDGSKTTVSEMPNTESLTNTGTSKQGKQNHVVIEGLDSGTVIGIAFAAFIIGVLMMGALWFIHTHSGSIFTSGPFKRSFGNRGSSEAEADYGETTPGSSAPISA